MSFDAHMERHRRLVILRCLSEIASHRTNTSVLRDGCVGLGVPSSRDQVTTTVAWLAEQGYVTTEAVGPGVTLVTLTARGLDIATGVAVHPDVARPSPR